MAWDGRLGDFDVHLEGTKLLAIPLVHFRSEADARVALEPHMRAWELRSDLENGVAVRFEFETAVVVDRQPTPGATTVFMAAMASLAGVGEITLKIGHAEYPRPSPPMLAENALVRDLLTSVHEVRSGEQRLLVGAYLFLTRLEFEFGGRPQAAAGIAVEEMILRKLGELSVVNDPGSRRKVKGPERALTDPEREWIHEALRRITLQVAEMAGGGNPAQLRMCDLPKV